MARRKKETSVEDQKKDLVDANVFCQLRTAALLLFVTKVDVRSVERLSYIQAKHIAIHGPSYEFPDVLAGLDHQHWCLGKISFHIVSVGDYWLLQKFVLIKRKSKSF